MLRYIIALGALAAVTAPAAAQVDSIVAVRRYGPSISSREGWLGIGVSCSRCTLSASDDGAARQWTFSEPPLVFSVDRNGPADRAALRTGDTLVAIDGVPLTSQQGGGAFANVRPGQTVRLTYRRGGAEHAVRLIAQSHPITDARQMEQAARALRRAHEAQARELEQSRGQLDRSRVELEEVRTQMEQMARGQSHSGLDTARLESLRRTLERQASALQEILAERQALEQHEESADAAMQPMPAMPATAPTPAIAPMAPMAAMPALPAIAPVAPMSYREHRGFGPLRYTGRLGDVVIEARGSGGVTATEVSDSEVVVTSGDLSVRLALRPRATPKPAPRPAAAARPPRD